MIRSGGPSPWSSHRSQYVLSRYISGYLNEEEKNLLSSLTSTVSAALEGQATAFFTSEICELHRIPSHPESHRRTQVIRERILALFPKIKKKTTIRPITKDKIGLFHTKKQINEMFHLFHQVQEHEIQKKTSSSQNDMIMYHIDEDTAVMKDTEKAALVAAGAVIDAVDLIMSQQPNFTADVVPIRNAFCGVRPPGHHAESHRSMGFCYFNNVGIGACHVLQKYPEEIKKVLILDFDVHHGNGTQAKFEVDHPMVHFISTHQAPFYPHTGGAHERGTHNNILNVPIPAGTDSKVYRQLFTKYITPSMEAFQPDFIFVSAGFDAHKMDPLAEIKLESEDYYWITQQVTQIAWKYAKGRIVSVLEGGYNLNAIAESSAAHVRGLIEGSIQMHQPTIKQTIPSEITTIPPPTPSISIEALSTEFSSAITVNEATKHLRLVVHWEGKQKVLILKDRTISLKDLMKQAKQKFNIKKHTQQIVDRHGNVITETELATLQDEMHIYLQ